MKFTRKSPATGKDNTREINITQAQYDDWKSGTHIQFAMPNASADDREFLLTGFTPEDWGDMFGEED